LNEKLFKNFINDHTTLYSFLDFVLVNINFKQLNIKGGFISCLDSSKVATRFKIISSIGRFLNSQNIKVISAREIDKLSTVFMTKNTYIKNDLYIDYVYANCQNIFIYLEFEKNLNDKEKLQIKKTFDIINNIIKTKNWDLSMKTIVSKIENLPALSKTVMDTLEFSTKTNKTPEELSEILSTDPLMVVSLLKTVNSAIFGFRNEVESLENLIYLMGIDFTISMILANSIEDSVEINISAYGIDQSEFKDFLALKLKFVTSWIRKEDSQLLKKLYLPLILHDIGKFIISKELFHANQIDIFLDELKKDHLNINKIERKYCDYTSPEITVFVLEYWKLNKNIINTLNGECKEMSKILLLIDIIFNIVKPLDEKCIEIALKQATSLNLNIELLKKEIEAITL